MQSIGQTAALCIQETRCVAPADLQLDVTASTPVPELDPDGNCHIVIKQLLANAANRSPKTDGEVHHLYRPVEDGARIQSPRDFFSPSEDGSGERAGMYFNYEDTLSCLTEDTLLGDDTRCELTAEYQGLCFVDDELLAADQQLLDMQYPVPGRDDTACQPGDATSALSVKPGEELQHLLSPTPSSSRAPHPTNTSTPSTEIPASPPEPGPAPPPPPPQKTILIGLLPPLLPMPSPPEQSNNGLEENKPHRDSLDIEMRDETKTITAGYPTPPTSRPSLSDDAGAAQQPEGQPSSGMSPLPRVAESIIKESISKQMRRKPPEDHDFSDILRKVREALEWDGRYESLEPEEQHSRAREASFRVENYLHQITAKITRRRTVSYHTKKHAVSVIANILLSVVQTRQPMALHVRRWCHSRDSSLLAALRAFSPVELDQFASEGFRELDALIQMGVGFIFPSLELIRDFVMDRGQVRRLLGYWSKQKKSMVEGTARKTRLAKEKTEKVKSAKVAKAAKKGETKKAEKEGVGKKTTRKKGTKKMGKAAVIEIERAEAMEEGLGEVGGAEC